MKEFGRRGRFANQLFQYAFLKNYAKQHDCELQLPPWVGQYLFGHNDLAITDSLPRFEEFASSKWALYPHPPKGNELVNHDFHGYAQYHTSYYEPFKEDWKKQFTPRKEVLERLTPAVEKLKSYGRPIVGIHLRRGDYGQMHFYITPLKWYFSCLSKMGLENPILFIATENQDLVEEFRVGGYRIETTENLGVEMLSELPSYNYLRGDKDKKDPSQMDFYPDFYLLSQCEHLLIPNSTFSFAAAMLSPSLKSCYQSSLITEQFHKIDPWNAWPLQRDSVDDYPSEGTTLETNLPYWRMRHKKNKH